MQLIIRAPTGLCVGDGRDELRNTWTPSVNLHLNPLNWFTSVCDVRITALCSNSCWHCKWFWFFLGRFRCRNCKWLFWFFLGSSVESVPITDWHERNMQNLKKKTTKRKENDPEEERRTDGRTVSGGKTSWNVLLNFSVDSSQSEDLIWNGGKTLTDVTKSCETHRGTIIFSSDRSLI